MSDDWAGGYVRRKQPRPAPFIRYTGDHDALCAWIEQHGQFHGMASIDAPLHDEPRREIWYANGQQFEVAHGQYVVLEGMTFRPYAAEQMERWFDLAEGDE